VNQQPAHPTATTISAPPPPAATPQSLDYARPLFFESQRFSQWWVWALLLIPMSLSVVVAVMFLRQPRSRGALLFPMAISLVVPLMMATMRMSVVVTSERVTARFFPLRRRIAIAEIASFRALTYTLRDFGGWGIKWARDGSLVLNVSGNRAIRINRRRGKSLILGTQRPDEFAAALEGLGVPREPD
jgi:hypothetical protein